VYSRIDDYEGMNTFNAANPATEGKSRIDLTDAKGTRITQEIIKNRKQPDVDE